MQININDTTIDWQFQKASKYLPVRLSTTFFDGIGECIAFAANRADGTTCDITENDDSEIFLTLMDTSFYEELKRDVLNMDYWYPRNHYNTVTGLADGKVRKIHLDGRYFLNTITTMRRYATEAEMNCIPNVNYKRNHICSMYTRHCDYTDPQGYLMEQLELNPKLLAWLFDDNSLIGKSHFALDGERYEAFQDFYNSLDIYD